MKTFECPGCTGCSLLSCQNCFDKKMSLEKNVKTKLLLIKLAAEIFTVFGPDNFASTLINNKLILFQGDLHPSFAHIRRQLLGYDLFYSSGITKPSDPATIEIPTFSIKSLPSPGELYENFEKVEAREFFHAEELPVIESEVNSEINIHCTRVTFSLSYTPDIVLLFQQYRDKGALTDLTIRPHDGNNYSLNDKALNIFSHHLIEL